MRVRQGYHCIRSKRTLVHSAAFQHRIDVEGGERPFAASEINRGSRSNGRCRQTSRNRYLRSPELARCGQRAEAQNIKNGPDSGKGKQHHKAGSQKAKDQAGHRRHQILCLRLVSVRIGNSRAVVVEVVKKVALDQTRAGATDSTLDGKVSTMTIINDAETEKPFPQGWTEIRPYLCRMTML
jgi:hypothetical protein